METTTTAPHPSTKKKKKKSTRSLAILGTGSDVGKSILTAGICRIFSNASIQVAPFKAQNMSNNAHPALDSTTGGYGEIGIAQAIQARACRQIPRVEMNPILLKSGGRRESDGAYLCSVLVMGKHYATEDYGALGARTETLMDLVLEAHGRLSDAGADVIVLEGAGSCTELNLKARDIVNIPLVRRLDCPWILVANIDPGGVFAQIVGTKACLEPEEWDLCVGVIVNKLRGEVKYFEPGPSMLEEMVGKPIFVVPYLYDLNIAEEDGMGLERKLANEHTAYSSSDDTKKRVVVICYPHISMTDDLLPVEMDTRFQVEWRRHSRPPQAYPYTTAVILPGSRQTRADLQWLLQHSFWKEFLTEHVANGGTVLGLCGGYQMLGTQIVDEAGVESGVPGTDVALGLLPVTTTLGSADKKVVKGMQTGTILPMHSANATTRMDATTERIPVEGFEIHCGQTELNEVVSNSNNAITIRPLVQLSNGQPDGFTNGRTIHGTYIHGILQSSAARAHLLGLDEHDAATTCEEAIDPLDRLATHLESCGLGVETLTNLMNQHFQSRDVD
jgi:adenosylcobyric acid synthase